MKSKCRQPYDQCPKCRKHKKCSRYNEKKDELDFSVKLTAFVDDDIIHFETVNQSETNLKDRIYDLMKLLESRWSNRKISIKANKKVVMVHEPITREYKEEDSNNGGGWK